MAKNDRAFFDGCDSFKNYANIGEYKVDIRQWLALSDWHYAEEQADKLMEWQSAYSEQAYASRECRLCCHADARGR
jgi:hypothetical protein